MDRVNQQRIMEEIFSSFRETMMQTLPRVPKDWDGIDLRQWFAFKAAELYAVSMPSKRKADIRNEIAVRNL
jgi:hypothetical protein